MKSNIFNVLGWFNKPACNCESKNDTNIVRAVFINEVEALEKILKDKKIKFNKSDVKRSRLYNMKSFSYRMSINGFNIFIDAMIENTFRKDACLACNTCLGWKHVSCENRGLNIYVDEVKGESPEEYFNGLINIEMSRINEEKSAKEICGEI